jgi:translation initiation factor 2 subunit 3
MEYNINQELQPLLTIATQGRVANGKTSLITNLTGTNPMKFIKEIVNSMTIKLGYTNAKFYKCETCPKPYCYQVNNNKCSMCGKQNTLVLHVSFVDSPGHNDLQATALSGASNVDNCLLIVSADCEQDPETNEHYKAIKILNLLEKTIIVHNKIDLVTKAKAIERYEQIRINYDIKYVVPICAQFGFGVNYLAQLMCETIPNPINDEFMKKVSEPLKISIIRSFDVNKPGTAIKDITGAVVGGTIKRGSLKIGDKIKIIPGIIKSTGQNQELEAYVTSLKTENTKLDVAYPGGLIGIGLSIDAYLSKEDRLVGNFIIKPDDETNKVFKTCTILFKKYNEEQDLEIKKGETYVCLLGSIKRFARINSINFVENTINITTNFVMAGEVGDSIIITKNNHIEIYGTIVKI